MTKFTYHVHRIVAGVFLIVGIFSIVNYYLDLGFFGRGAKGVLLFNALLFVIYGAFFAPTRQERQQHQNPPRSTQEGD